VTGTQSTDLSGQVAVITGGAGAIGSATAALFADRGASVVILDQVVPVRTAFPEARLIQCDVTDAGSLGAAARTVRDEFGGCDVLIISAGVAVVGPAGETSEADWDRIFGVNVRGAWLTFREFLPFLRRPASVVTVASAAGLRPLPQLAAYSAAKAALIGLTRAIAIDYSEDGIRANCVCPGQVDTPLAAEVQADRPASLRAAVAEFADYPIKRAASPSEVADAIAFLSAPSGGYMTGAAIAVDGGRTLH